MRLLVYLLLLSHCCFAQNSGAELDSLLLVSKGTKNPTDQLELYLKISKLYQNSNPSEGIAYGEKAQKMATQLKDADQLALSEMSIGANYYNLGDIEKAKGFYLSALKKAKKKETLSECQTLIGKYYLAKSDYPQALSYNLKALKLSEEASYQLGIANASYTIAITYNYLKKPENALSYFRKALAIHQKLNNKKGIRSNLVGIASQYEFLSDYQQAKKYYMQAKDLAYEMNDDFAIATTSASLGNLLFRLDEIEPALELILASKAAAEKINNARAINSAKFLEARMYLKLYKDGKSYKKVNLLGQAEKLLVEAIEADKLSGNKIVITQGLEQLAEVYSLRNEHKKAKETYELFMKYTDSVYNEDAKQTIKSLEDQRTIELKNKEIQVNKLTLANQEKEKWFLISGLLFLAILGGMLLYQNHNRKKTNLKLQALNQELDVANKTKTRFFSILNHDLREPVSNLIHFLHLQKENPELLDDESRKRMENKTILGAENLLDSMEDILLWSKGQMEHFKPQMEKVAVSSVFEDTRKHFSSEEKVKIAFENPTNIQMTTDENYLKTIIRNLTGNAIKALKKSENATVTWKAWQDNGQTYLSITDNGPGASDEQFRALYDEKEVVGIKTGLGLHLIRDLAKAIGCGISVNSKINLGTTITLQF